MSGDYENWDATNVWPTLIGDSSPVENNRVIFAVRRTGQDAYIYTSEDHSRVVEWWRRFAEKGYAVEIVEQTVSCLIYTQRSDWTVVASPVDVDLTASTS